MKKLILILSLIAFVGAGPASMASVSDGIVKVECDKCGGKNGKCTKECKKAQKEKGGQEEVKKSCSHGTEGAAATEGEAPKSCGAKKSCCKSKSKASNETKTEEAAPAAK